MAPVRRKPKEVMSPEFKSRYQEVMDSLSKPVSSYTLIYEPYLIPKTRGRKKAGAQNDNVIATVFRAFRAKPDSTHENKPEEGDVDANANAFVALKSKPEPMKPEKRAMHKELAKKFPANVRDLTGSGILDGVLVRYVSKTKQVELGGIIKGPGYLCGCASCNYSKTLTADDFENHAGCKTSHSNNHIHLENGKSMHMVVKELLNTPRNILCDVIQSVVGSTLNQEAFSTWKASYQANNCEAD